MLVCPFQWSVKLPGTQLGRRVDDKTLGCWATIKKASTDKRVRGETVCSNAPEWGTLLTHDSAGEEGRSLAHGRWVVLWRENIRLRKGFMKNTPVGFEVNSYGFAPEPSIPTPKLWHSPKEPHNGWLWPLTPASLRVTICEKPIAVNKRRQREQMGWCTRLGTASETPPPWWWCVHNEDRKAKPPPPLLGSEKLTMTSSCKPQSALRPWKLVHRKQMLASRGDAHWVLGSRCRFWIKWFMLAMVEGGGKGSGFSLNIWLTGFNLSKPESFYHLHVSYSRAFDWFLKVQQRTLFIYRKLVISLIMFLINFQRNANMPGPGWRYLAIQQCHSWY